MSDSSKEKNQIAQRKVYSAGIEKSDDYMLPEYYDDMLKILNVSARAKTNGKYIGSKNLDIDGELIYSVCFLNTQNKIRTVMFQCPIEESFEIDGISDSDNVIVSMDVVSKNYRMLSPRKINLKSKINCDAEYTNQKDISLEICGKHGQGDERFIEKKYKYEDCSSTVVYEDKGIEYDEFIPAENGELLDDVICFQMNTEINEIKYQDDGKVLIKGVSCFSGLFESESGDYVHINKKLPLSYEMEAEAANSNSMLYAVADLKDLRVGLNVDSNDSQQLIELEYLYDFILQVSNKDKAKMIVDAYSTSCEDILRYENAEIFETIGTEHTSFSLNTSKSLSELKISGKPICVFSNAVLDGIEYDPEKNKAIAEGNCNYKVIYSDEDKSYSFCEFKENFKYEMPSNGGKKSKPDIFYICNCELISNNMSSDENKIYCDSEISISFIEVDTSKHEIVKEIELHTDVPAEGNNGKIKIYYPDKNETVWDVAKKYKLSENELKIANQMSEDNEKCQKIMVIPERNTKDGEIYSRII